MYGCVRVKTQAGMTVIGLREHVTTWNGRKLRDGTFAFCLSLQMIAICMKEHCVIIHTYSYQIGPSNFILLVKIQENWQVKFDVGGDNTSTSYCYLYCHPENINHELCSDLSNNLNLRSPTWYIYVCMMTPCCFSPSLLHMSIGWFKTLFHTGIAFQPYKTCHALVQFISLHKNVQRFSGEVY